MNKINNIDVLNLFRKLLWNLKNRRSMYIFDSKYMSLIHYIDGFNLAVKNIYSIDIISEFHAWLKTREHYKFSTHWGIYILKYMSLENEKNAIENIFNLLEEFINEKLNV